MFSNKWGDKISAISSFQSVGAGFLNAFDKSVHTTFTSSELIDKDYYTESMRYSVSYLLPEVQPLLRLQSLSRSRQQVFSFKLLNQILTVIARARASLRDTYAGLSDLRPFAIADEIEGH